MLFPVIQTVRWAVDVLALDPADRVFESAAKSRARRVRAEITIPLELGAARAGLAISGSTAHGSPGGLSP